MFIFGKFGTFLFAFLSFFYSKAMELKPLNDEQKNILDALEEFNSEKEYESTLAKGLEEVLNKQNENNENNCDIKNICNNTESYKYGYTITLRSGINGTIRLFGNIFLDNIFSNSRIYLNDSLVNDKKNITSTAVNVGDIIKLTICSYKPITNLSHMFNSCDGLAGIDLSEFSFIDDTNVSYMFYNCKLLVSLHGLDKLNSKISDMSYMFSGCYSLRRLPNIRKWDTSNVTNMSYIFDRCYS